jgi:hypothetical protein
MEREVLSEIIFQKVLVSGFADVFNSYLGLRPKGNPGKTLDLLYA